MAQILRVSVAGRMPGGEKWSVNPCWEIDGATGSFVTAAEATAIATALGNVAPGAAILQSWASGTDLQSYRVEARNLDGTLQTQAEFIKPIVNAGTGSTPHPYQTSLVLSLRTAGVGPSARGRMYWPATGVALDSSTYRVNTTTHSGLLAAYKTYLSAMETAIQATLPNANLTVWSRTTQNFHNVNALQLGNICDTQRRRRDTLVESVLSASYP